MRELGIQPLPSSLRRSINIRPAPVCDERCHGDDAPAEHIWHRNDMIKVKPEDRLQRSADKISPITLSILFSTVAVGVVAVLSWYYMSERSAIPQIRDASQSSQHAPNLSPPPKTTALAPLQLPTAITPAAAAENINANLCKGNSSNALERTLSSAATGQLVKYLEGLKKGSYVFNWTISGHDFAKQQRRSSLKSAKS
jgi:hypothetical protein